MVPVTVTKQDMSLLPVTPFAMLSDRFARNIMERMDASLGMYRLYSLEFLDEGDEPAAERPVQPKQKYPAPVFNIDLKLVLEALRAGERVYAAGRDGKPGSAGKAGETGKIGSAGKAGETGKIGGAGKAGETGKIGVIERIIQRELELRVKSGDGKAAAARRVSAPGSIRNTYNTYNSNAVYTSHNIFNTSISAATAAARGESAQAGRIAPRETNPVIARNVVRDRQRASAPAAALAGGRLAPSAKKELSFSESLKAAQTGGLTYGGSAGGEALSREEFRKRSVAAARAESDVHVPAFVQASQSAVAPATPGSAARGSTAEYGDTPLAVANGRETPISGGGQNPPVPSGNPDRAVGAGRTLPAVAEGYAPETLEFLQEQSEGDSPPAVPGMTPEQERRVAARVGEALAREISEAERASRRDSSRAQHSQTTTSAPAPSDTGKGKTAQAGVGGRAQTLPDRAQMSPDRAATAAAEAEALAKTGRAGSVDGQNAVPTERGTRSGRPGQLPGEAERASAEHGRSPAGSELHGGRTIDTQTQAAGTSVAEMAGILPAGGNAGAARRNLESGVTAAKAQPEAGGAAEQTGDDRAYSGAEPTTFAAYPETPTPMTAPPPMTLELLDERSTDGASGESAEKLAKEIAQSGEFKRKISRITQKSGELAQKMAHETDVSADGGPTAGRPGRAAQDMRMAGELRTVTGAGTDSPGSVLEQTSAPAVQSGFGGVLDTQARPGYGAVPAPTDYMTPPAGETETVQQAGRTGSSPVAQQAGRAGSSPVAQQAGRAGSSPVSQQAGRAGSSPVAQQAGHSGSSPASQQAGRTGSSPVPQQTGRTGSTPVAQQAANTEQRERQAALFSPMDAGQVRGIKTVAPLGGVAAQPMAALGDTSRAARRGMTTSGTFAGTELSPEAEIMPVLPAQTEYAQPAPGMAEAERRQSETGRAAQPSRPIESAPKGASKSASESPLKNPSETPTARHGTAYAGEPETAVIARSAQATASEPAFPPAARPMGTGAETMRTAGRGDFTGVLDTESRPGYGPMPADTEYAAAPETAQSADAERKPTTAGKRGTASSATAPASYGSSAPVSVGRARGMAKAAEAGAVRSGMPYRTLGRGPLTVGGAGSPAQTAAAGGTAARAAFRGVLGRMSGSTQRGGAYMARAGELALAPQGGTRESDYAAAAVSGQPAGAFQYPGVSGYPAADMALPETPAGGDRIRPGTRVNGPMSAFSAGSQRTMAGTQGDMGVISKLSQPSQGQTVWNNPYMSSAPSTALRSKQPKPALEERQQNPQQVRISEAEIRRTADRVYQLLTERIARERRRVGL